MKSQKILFFTMISLLLIFYPVPIKSQDKQFELIKGVPRSELLKAEEKHRYTVKLDAGRFAYFVFIADDIDALITAYDPDGKKLQSVYSPYPVMIFSDKKGDYILEVKTLVEKGEVKTLVEKSHVVMYKLSWEKLEPKGTTPEKQIDQIFSIWNSLDSPGAAVAVEKDGKIIFKKGYGNAELEYNVPITPQTVFHVASVSKQFTCFSILLLEKEGKLSLNDDIRKYIPEVPDFGKVITLNHLMHHTSGLRDQWVLLLMAGWRFDDNITKEHIIRLVSRQKELNFNPGDEFEYCNTGFTLLAEVVARVAGQSFPEFTRTHIFEPLKMTHTLFYDDCEKIVKNRAYSFDLDSSGYKKRNLNYSNVGATSLFTTAVDLCHWATNFENPVVGDKDIINRMNLRGILNNGDTIHYAMGQNIVKYKGLKTISHGGGDAGYRSFLVRFPDQKFSVNVLSNLGTFNPVSMAFIIADMYLKDKEVVSGPKKEDTETKESTDAKEVKVDHDLFLTYCGNYELQPGNVATISIENENLFFTTLGLAKTPMNSVGENEFEVKELSARVTFMQGDSGKISEMKVVMNGEEHYAVKLPEFDPAKVNLADYTGNFFSDELNTTYSLVVESGKLIARHFRTGDVKLTPTKTDHYSGDQWYFGSIEYERDQAGRIKGFRVTSGSVRNLKFQKVSDRI